VTVGTHEEGEVDDYEHRSGADGAAEDGRATSTSVVVTGVSAASTLTTSGPSDAAATRVARAATVDVRHGYRAQHTVVHHRFRLPARREPETGSSRRKSVGRSVGLGLAHRRH